MLLAVTGFVIHNSVVNVFNNLIDVTYRLEYTCRIVGGTTSPLVQPVKTRWATYLNMLKSLLKHRSALSKQFVTLNSEGW
jgi:hypothetical protein